MRVILITGGNGGLGLAMVRAFLNESKDNLVWLGIHSRRDQADKLVVEFPGNVATVELDVTKADSWKKAVEEILSRHKRIDVLVNNAGKHADALLATMPLNSWDNVIETNLDATFHGCQAVLPTMISQRSGRIVNIASL